ncbi:uncharacterized protein LOC116340217 [Contarinia nasturtii]|uniref:uncharacterized protein LOC116340217 n=1 Tax=Contarinia nasturtii TaxID=265458 RepID=UPI0012D486C4|nr:uncharacterized protein LOC116340217 [Contarinia nasturtii]
MDSTEMCLSCMNEIGKREKTIRCNGACGKKIHIDCTHLENSAIVILEKNDNIHYICDTCERFSMKTINNKIDGLFKFIYEINDRTKKSEKEQSELKAEVKKISEYMKGEDADRKKEREKGRAISNISLTTPSERNTNDMRYTNARIHQKANTPVAMREKQSTSKTNAINATKRAAEKQTNISITRSNESTDTPKSITKKTTTTKTRGVASERLSVSDNNKVPTHNGAHSNGEKKVNKEGDINETKRLLIKPKTDNNIQHTIARMNEKIDVQTVSFKNVIKHRNGTVIIECEDDSKFIDLVERIGNALGDEYSVREIKQANPKVKIIGMSEKPENNELIERIKSQNEMLYNANITVIKITRDHKNSKTFDAIIQIDYENYGKLMQTKKVNINWDRCIVKEHFSIMRCHKCVGFGHTKDQCSIDERCGYCSGNHLSNECQSETIGCINCTEANKKMNLGLDTKHNAWSKKCEILTRKIEQIRVKERSVRNE